MILVVLKMKQRISRQKNMFDIYIYIYIYIYIKRVSINIMHVAQVPHTINTHS